MPLAYDDVDGSWGPQSHDWSKVRVSRMETSALQAACVKNRLVPYGSYVIFENEFRVETKELLDKVKAFLWGFRSK